MMKKETYLNQILQSLIKLKPKMVMIFGSYASDSYDEESDLDLLIVLDENKIPKNYDEKLEMKLRIRRAIREINKKIAIDLLVYTMPEYKEFIESGSAFSREIKRSGRVLYEKAS